MARSLRTGCWARVLSYTRAIGIPSAVSAAMKSLMSKSPQPCWRYRITKHMHAVPHNALTNSERLDTSQPGQQLPKQLEAPPTKLLSVRDINDPSRKVRTLQA